MLRGTRRLRRPPISTTFETQPLLGRVAALLSRPWRRLRARHARNAGRRADDPPDPAHLCWIESALVHHYRRPAPIRGILTGEATARGPRPRRAARPQRRPPSARSRHARCAARRSADRRRDRGRGGATMVRREQRQPQQPADIGRVHALRPGQILQRRAHALVQHLAPPKRPRQRLDHGIVVRSRRLCRPALGMSASRTFRTCRVRPDHCPAHDRSPRSRECRAVP